MSTSVDVLDVKMAADLLSVVSKDTALKWVASTGGGEYAGACPFCGGDDRFRLQRCAPPGKTPSGSRWMCRQCSPDGRWGDVVGYVEKRYGLDFRGALAWLAELYHLAAGGAIAAAPPPPKEKDIDGVDRAQWTEAALVFWEESVKQLWAPDGEKALAYLHGRGLSDDELKLWQIGFNPVGNFGNPEAWGLPAGSRIYVPRGIVIGCQDAAGLHYLKVRQSQANPRYLVLKGGHLWPFGLPTFEENFTAFLFESELDVLLAHQSELVAGYASMPAGQPIKPTYQSFFEDITDVLVCFDNDDEGQKAAEKLCRLPSFTQGDKLPMGKDLTEFAQAGGDVLEYLLSQLEMLDRRRKA